MEYLNAMSIAAQLAGLILIFIYGTNPMQKREGNVYLYNVEEMPAIEKAARRNKVFGNTGYLLCIASLVLQVIVSLF